MKDMMIGVDLAKNVFQVHGALRTGEVQFRKKLTRKQLSEFMAQQAPVWSSLKPAAARTTGRARWKHLATR